MGQPGSQANYCANCGKQIVTRYIDSRSNFLCSAECKRIYEVKEEERKFYKPPSDFHTLHKDPPDF